MNSVHININTLNIDKHFFLRHALLANKSCPRTKMVRYSLLAVNEATICHLIRKIPNYASFFSLLSCYKPLRIAEISDDGVQTMPWGEENRYFMFSYNDVVYKDFSAFLYGSTNIRKLVSDCIFTFQHLLQALCLLDRRNITFFCISPQNIVFLEGYREKPVLIQFHGCVNRKKLTTAYISPLLEDLDSFTYLPLEVHFLYALLKQGDSLLSVSSLHKFCETFVETIPFMQLFSERYRTLYLEQCIQFLKKYIELPQNQIIEDILERNGSWDVYSISVLYLHIFGCMNRVFSLKGTFISKITMELAKNMHPNPEKRSTLPDIVRTLDTLLEQQDGWAFIKNMDNNKLSKLFEELAK